MTLLQVRGSREAMTIQDWAAQRCTISYRAPELFNVESHCIIDERTDIWVKLCRACSSWLMCCVCLFSVNVTHRFSFLCFAVPTVPVTWLCALLYDDVGRAVRSDISEGRQCCSGCPESGLHPSLLQVSLQAVA